MPFGNWCASCGRSEPEDLVKEWPLAPGGHGDQTVNLCEHCRGAATAFRGNVEEAKKLAAFGITHTLLQEKTADDIISEIGPVAGNLHFANSAEIARVLNQRGYVLPHGIKFDKNSAAALVIAYRARVAGAGGHTYDHQECGCQSCLASAKTKAV